ncbi:MAG: hypothetical protein M3O91_01620 [Chloroflexota bacterium]|nr:hypothetical protein [Chloroflexota bacterium]
MRFAIAVIASAALQLGVFMRISDWIGATALVALVWVLFASLGAGFFAGRRAWLAGLLGVLVAAIGSGVASYARYGPDLGVGWLLEYETRLILLSLPYAAAGAIAAVGGGWLRRRALGVRA